jgi:protein SCO1/2
VRRIAALVFALGVPLLAAGCGTDTTTGAEVVRQGNHGFRGTYVAPPYDVPAVELTDTDGRPFTLARDDHAVDVVFFGYANCPDVCQVVMGQITSAYLRLEAADRARVRVVFVTTDPARDTPHELAAYLARFQPAFTGLTGPIDRIDALGKPLGVFVKKGERLPSGGYDVAHTTSVFAVTHGRAPLVWPADTSATDLAADLTRLLQEQA